METPDYPTNNRYEREVKPSRESKNIKRVVNGKVVRKRRQSQGFSSAFQDIFEYVAKDVFIPYAKDMVSDAIVQGSDRLLFGESRKRPTARRNSNSNYGRVSYNRYSKPSAAPRRNEPAPRQSIERPRAIHQFDDIILASRIEADEVIDRLYDLLSQYEVVTVADFYELLGISPKYTDENWGWTDLRGATARRVRTGFMLDLPEPSYLD